jgi:hypothetical protein
MPNCDHCERDVIKLLEHPFTHEGVCLKCMTRSGFFSRLTDEDTDVIPRERRSNVRVPVTIEMAFDILDISYAAYTVNMALAGICFAWEHCQQCAGYDEGAIDDNCIFAPFYIHGDSPKELMLKFAISETYTMEIPTQIVYTIKEPSMDVEYVGAKFLEVSEKDNLLLEVVIAKFGQQKQ